MDKKDRLANSDDSFHAQERFLASIILEHDEQIEEKRRQIAKSDAKNSAALIKEIAKLINSRETAVKSLSKIMRSVLTGTNKRTH